jgi:uncharacterized membrane protein YphA (DoxX/SURF4 family)
MCVNPAWKPGAKLHPTSRQGDAMNAMRIEKGLIVFFRLAMAWTFLYAGLRQVFFSDFSVVPFLSHTRTFHGAQAACSACCS